MNRGAKSSWYFLSCYFVAALMDRYNIRKVVPVSSGLDATRGRLPQPVGRRHGLGITLMVGSTLLFTGMNAVAKILGTGYSLFQLIFFRSIFAILPLGLALVCRGALTDLKAHRPLGHALRAVCGFASLGGYFYAFPRLPLVTVVAISFAAPLFVFALSWPMLREQVAPRHVIAVAAGFSGILMILQPSANGLDIAVVVTVFASMFHALVSVLVRYLNRTEAPAAIVFYYLVLSMFLSGFALPFVWVKPDPRDWLLFVALGLFGGSAQLLMTMAFRHGEAAVIAPI